MSRAIRNGYKSFLKLEKSLSKNSIEAYLRDIDKLYKFAAALKKPKPPREFDLKELQQFVYWIADLGMNAQLLAFLLIFVVPFFILFLFLDAKNKQSIDRLNRMNFANRSF